MCVDDVSLHAAAGCRLISHHRREDQAGEAEGKAGGGGCIGHHDGRGGADRKEPTAARKGGEEGGATRGREGGGGRGVCPLPHHEAVALLQADDGGIASLAQQNQAPAVHQVPLHWCQGPGTISTISECTARAQRHAESSVCEWGRSGVTPPTPPQKKKKKKEEEEIVCSGSSSVAPFPTLMSPMQCSPLKQPHKGIGNRPKEGRICATLSLSQHHQW